MVSAAVAGFAEMALDSAELAEQSFVQLVVDCCSLAQCLEVAVEVVAHFADPYFDFVELAVFAARRIVVSFALADAEH